MTPPKGGPRGGIDRRGLLKLAGASTAGIAALSGAASAHPPDEIRFCGCSRVCVDSTENYRVFYATGDHWGYVCSLEPGTDELAESEPNCFEADDDQKIIGVLGGSRNVYWNPNQCTQEILDGFSLDDCTGCEDDACDYPVRYRRVGRHEYEAVGQSVTVRTRNCRPPSEWEWVPEPPQGLGPV